MIESVDVLIIGGGPAGMAAALGARESGAASVLILEREQELGGILRQCIHNGFGLHRFQTEMTGSEYARRDADRIKETDILYRCDTTVLSLAEDLSVETISSIDGCRRIHAGSIVLAMGCRERPRGAIMIPGTRCAGVMTAGTAQRLVNLEGLMPGRRIVILGSGDIGLIMARRLTCEGAKVLACVEMMPFSGGLKRNIVQCLDDYSIPLLLSHTVVNIEGLERVEAVTIAKVDSLQQPIPGSEQRIECDTLLLSVGLIPENELSRQILVALSAKTGGPIVDKYLETSVASIFACGNVLHVHDLVDEVSAEAMTAGRNAALYSQGKRGGESAFQLTGSVEKAVSDVDLLHLSSQTAEGSQADVIPVTCVNCPIGCVISVRLVDGQILSVEGQQCPRGEKYARSEVTNPRRMLTTLIVVQDRRQPLPVRTQTPIPKTLIADALSSIHRTVVSAPIHAGEVILLDLCGTGIPVIATADLL